MTLSARHVTLAGTLHALALLSYLAPVGWAFVDALGAGLVALLLSTWINRLGINAASLKCMAAMFFSYGLLWIGLEVNCVQYSSLDERGKRAWAQQYGFEATATGNEVCIVAGFPLRCVEGTDGCYYQSEQWAKAGIPSAREVMGYPTIRMGKGGVCLMTNYLVLLAAALGGMVIKVSRRTAGWVLSVCIGIGMVGEYLGRAWVLWNC